MCTKVDGQLIYAAQSKRFYYCRDAVCEFIFRAGHIPMHPFRLFGYYLNERVSRSVVRAANSAVLAVCDQLWVFGETISDGVYREILECRGHGKPVRHFSIDSRVKLIKSIELSELRFERTLYTHHMSREILLECIREPGG
jgi:hypothetical protein